MQRCDSERIEASSPEGLIRPVRSTRISLSLELVLEGSHIWQPRLFDVRQSPAQQRLRESSPLLGGAGEMNQKRYCCRSMAAAVSHTIHLLRMAIQSTARARAAPPTTLMR